MIIAVGVLGYLLSHRNYNYRRHQRAGACGLHNVTDWKGFGDLSKEAELFDGSWV